MKKSTVLAAALVSISVVGSSQAHADGSFAKGGEIVLSAERLFGLSVTSMTTEDGSSGRKVTDSQTNVSLFWPPQSALTFSPYTIPHLGFDYIVGGGFTVGGSLGFISGTGTTKTEPVGMPSTERDDAKVTVLAFAPRIGYAMALTPLIAFWPRGGITYFSIKSERTSQAPMPITTKTTISGVGLNLEPMFVFSPADHFGIVAGPVIDIPLSGTSSSEQTPQTGTPGPDDKIKFANYGIAVGLLGYF